MIEASLCFFINVIFCSAYFRVREKSGSVIFLVPSMTTIQRPTLQPRDQL